MNIEGDSRGGTSWCGHMGGYIVLLTTKHEALNSDVLGSTVLWRVLIRR